MLYISIIALIIFIFILVVFYRRSNMENFAMTSGYVEKGRGHIKKLNMKVVQSEIDSGELTKLTDENQDKLQERIKSLKAKQRDMLQQMSKQDLYDGEDELNKQYGLGQKFFDNKELYSILINNLTSSSITNSSLTDSYGLKGINYKSKKLQFNMTVTDTVNVACELLQQKQDYRYLSKCVESIKSIGSAAKIHNLIIRAYTYITHPKNTSNRVIDPYLVNKLNENIEKIISLGREITYADSNTCKCKSGKNEKILKNNLIELGQAYLNIQNQITNTQATLNTVRMASKINSSNFFGNIIKTPSINNLKFFGNIIKTPSINNLKVTENLKKLKMQANIIAKNINTVKAAFEENKNFQEKGCKPC